MAFLSTSARGNRRYSTKARCCSGASTNSTTATAATSCTSATPLRTRTTSTRSDRRCGTQRGRVTCNLFLYSPNGKTDGVQVIPISEVAAKDEFLGIKDAIRDDILAAHRVPPALLGIAPKNTGGFGAIEPAARMFVKNELEPPQHRFRELNDWIGEEVVRFEPDGLDTRSG